MSPNDPASQRTNGDWKSSMGQRRKGEHSKCKSNVGGPSKTTVCSRTITGTREKKKKELALTTLALKKGKRPYQELNAKGG